MPALAMPPAPPAIRAPAPACHILAQAEADEALARLRRRLPSTPFESAHPSAVCGLAVLRLKSGKLAYTDATGRFLLLALALDTHSGSPAETSEALEQALARRASNSTPSSAGSPDED